MTHLPKVIELFDLQQRLANKKQPSKQQPPTPPILTPISPSLPIIQDTPSPSTLGKRKDPFGPTTCDTEPTSTDNNLEILNDPNITGIPTDPHSLRTLPPAYLKAVGLREKRRMKLINALNHLNSVLHGNNNNPEKIAISENNEKKSQDFDTEDLVLQKLLLAGISVEHLLSLPIRSLQEYSQGIHLLNRHELDLNSAEVTERDITDQEVYSLLNTPEEVQFLEKMVKLEDCENSQSKVKRAKLEKNLEKEELQENDSILTREGLD